MGVCYGSVEPSFLALPFFKLNWATLLVSQFISSCNRIWTDIWEEVIICLILLLLFVYLADAFIQSNKVVVWIDIYGNVWVCERRLIRISLNALSDLPYLLLRRLKKKILNSSLQISTRNEGCVFNNKTSMSKNIILIETALSWPLCHFQADDKMDVLFKVQYVTEIRDYSPVVTFNFSTSSY